MNKQEKGTAGSLGGDLGVSVWITGVMTSSPLCDTINQGDRLALPQYPVSSQDGVSRILGQVLLHGSPSSSDP